MDDDEDPEDERDPEEYSNQEDAYPSMKEIQKSISMTPTIIWITRIEKANTIIRIIMMSTVEKMMTDEDSGESDD